jgi:patatin-like phospholipase/acyl hydrolase
MAYRILSLDGGGIRGLFQAKYLTHLQNHLGKPLHQCFDMIAGTSTGSIVAMGISIGADTGKISDLFLTDGPSIFYDDFDLGHFSNALRSGPKYDAKNLRVALDKVLHGLKLDDAKCDLVIPAFTLNTYEPKVFSNLYRKLAIDLGLSATDIVLCSCAAPTYFPASQPAGAARTFVDGGIFANDPSLVAAMVAHVEKGIPFNEMKIFRLGNGKVQGGMTPDVYNELRGVNTIEPILQMMFEGQADGNHAVLKMLVPNANLLRVDPQLVDFVKLDDARAAAAVLPARAEEEWIRSHIDLLKLLGEIEQDEDGGSSVIFGAEGPISSSECDGSI